MPDEKDQKLEPRSESEMERVAKAMAKAEADAQKRNADETTPGGRYKTPAGDVVDAEGKPVKG